MTTIIIIIIIIIIPMDNQIHYKIINKRCAYGKPLRSSIFFINSINRDFMTHQSSFDWNFSIDLPIWVNKLPTVDNGIDEGAFLLTNLSLFDLEQVAHEAQDVVDEGRRRPDVPRGRQTGGGFDAVVEHFQFVLDGAQPK